MLLIRVSSLCGSGFTALSSPLSVLVVVEVVLVIVTLGVNWRPLAIVGSRVMGIEVPEEFFLGRQTVTCRPPLQRFQVTMVGLRKAPATPCARSRSHPNSTYREDTRRSRCPCFAGPFLLVESLPDAAAARVISRALASFAPIDPR